MTLNSSIKGVLMTAVTIAFVSAPAMASERELQELRQMLTDAQKQLTTLESVAEALVVDMDKAVKLVDHYSQLFEKTGQQRYAELAKAASRHLHGISVRYASVKGRITDVQRVIEKIQSRIDELTKGAFDSNN